MVLGVRMFLVESSGKVSTRPIRTKTCFIGCPTDRSLRVRVELCISADFLPSFEVLVLKITRRIRRLANLVNKSNTSSSLESIQNFHYRREIVNGGNIKPRINLLRVVYESKVDVSPRWMSGKMA